MDMDTDPDMWRWVWLVASVVLILGELAIPGTFILLPFGVSAAVAALLAFLGVGVGWTWLVFVVVGIALWLVFWRFAKRFVETAEAPIGVGADRLLHQTGEVIAAIPRSPTGSGEVRLRGEVWRAESEDGSPIEVGTIIEVVSVQGTRVTVAPLPSTVPDEGS
jgi:membrane protein implicated in regulation of membrane protease activity